MTHTILLIQSSAKVDSRTWLLIFFQKLIRIITMQERLRNPDGLHGSGLQDIRGAPEETEPGLALHPVSLT